MKTGHFGMPAILVAGVALIALVLHFAVPYGYLAFRDNGSPFPDDEAVTRGDVAEWQDVIAVGPAGAGVTTAGLVIALVAGATMLVLGFVPMPVAAARWAGFGTAALTTVGALMAFMSSMFWVGGGPGGTFAQAGTPVSGGFTGLLEMWGGTDVTAMFWVISPIITAGLCIALFWGALRVARGVVTTQHGFRDRAGAHLKNAWWAIAFLGAVLLVPWSIVEQADPTLADDDLYFHGAHAVFVMNERTAGADAWYDGMVLTTNVFIATAWIGVLMAFAGAAGGVLASTGAPAGLSRATHWAGLLPLLMLVWSAVMYLLAWTTFWKPFDAAEAQPGYLPAIVLAPLAFWVMGLVPTLRRAFGLAGEAKAREPIAFD